MTTFENFLSEATSKMEYNTGGLSAVSGATISLAVRFSLYTETLDSDIPMNSAKITVTADGDIEIVTEQFAVTPGEFHKAFEWVLGTTMSSVHCGVRYYDVNGDMLEETSTEFAPMQTISWNGIYHVAKAPANTDVAEMYTIFDSLLIDEEVFLTHPSVMQQNKITPDFVDYALYNVPDYMIEADLNSTGYVPTPMVRYFTVGAKQMSDASSTVVDWDFVDEIDSLDGAVSHSSLTDPVQAEDGWLPWLAQLMGVTLGTVSSGSGRSPWLAFTEAGIDTWTEWEEDVDPASVPGVPDTEWIDIESYSPEFFDAIEGWRAQIATGYNGILGGTSEAITEYVATLLNTEEINPFIYVVKHYATNPYRILVAVLATEDPDLGGNLLETVVSATAPAGTSVEIGHGVSVTARNFYDPVRMFSNMFENVNRGGGTLPVRFVEGGSANGRHIALSSVTGATEPQLGGGVALARWFPGFAFYSGAMEVETGETAACNITGDIDIRILGSDMTTPASTVEIAASPNKWSLSVTSTGTLSFSWENSGTNTIESTEAVNWGNRDTGPFWLKVTLDVDNGASGHDVAFYRSPTLYEDTWTQIGTTVTTAGTSAIDSATTTLTMFGKETNPIDSVSCSIYRMMIHDGIDGTIAFDVNVTGEIDPLNSLVSTGTLFFRTEDTPAIDVTINPTVPGATFLVESEWTSQVHKGGDEYFYLGRSPYAFDTGNPASQGDTLVVSGLASDAYDWEITKLDQTTASGSTGTVTSITWDADDYGGTSIVDITVRKTSDQVIKAQFLPDLLAGATTTDTDSYGSTWTLTRAWTTTSIYEYSAYVDRDHISPTDDIGNFESGMVFDADETITASVMARRFWSGSGITNIVNHSSTSGWQIRYNGDDIEAKISSGPSTITLYYDEVAGGLLGEFILITLRRDITSKTITLWINDTEVDSIADPFTGEGLFTTTGSTGYVGDDAATNNFDFRYFGMFDRSLSGTDIGFLSEEMADTQAALPQAARAIEPAFMSSEYIVYAPTVVQV